MGAVPTALLVGLAVPGRPAGAVGARAGRRARRGGRAGRRCRRRRRPGPRRPGDDRGHRAGLARGPRPGDPVRRAARRPGRGGRPARLGGGRASPCCPAASARRGPWSTRTADRCRRTTRGRGPPALGATAMVDVSDGLVCRPRPRGAGQRGLDAAAVGGLPRAAGVPGHRAGAERRPAAVAARRRRRPRAGRDVPAGRRPADGLERRRPGRGGRGRAGRRRGVGRPGRLADASSVPTVLEPAEWLPRAPAHAARVDAWVQPHLARRRTGEKHPVEDFLFDYYHLSPAKLRRWHPGAGVVLAGPEAAAVPGARGLPAGRRRRHGRPATGSPGTGAGCATCAGCSSPPRRGRASYGCFGLHEWAMVYRQPADQVRHARPPAAAGQRRAPTPSSRPGRCGAPTSTPTGSSPRRRRRSTRCGPPGPPRSSWSSRAACTPGWTSTSGRRPSTRSCRPS